MTDLQTPPAPPAPPSPASAGGDSPSGPARRRPSATVIAILTVCAGGALIVGALGGALISGIRGATTGTDTLTADAAGIADIDVSVDRAQLEIVYGDVDRVELTVIGSPGDWRLTRDEDELSVRTDRGWWGDWSGGWFGPRGDRAVLTLPSAYADRALDASLSLSGGSLTTTGAFGDLDLDLSAGAIDVSGSARELDVDVSAGRATLDLSDVREGTVQVSAGEVSGELTGAAPRALDVEVSAGRVDLVLPDETYAVASDVSAGGFDNQLATSDSSTSRVTVSVSAGQVTLRPGS